MVKLVSKILSCHKNIKNTYLWSETQLYGFLGAQWIPTLDRGKP
jgi:hypothetical protein